jgi:hypothetical protein
VDAATPTPEIHKYGIDLQSITSTIDFHRRRPTTGHYDAVALCVPSTRSLLRAMSCPHRTSPDRAHFQSRAPFDSGLCHEASQKSIQKTRAVEHQHYSFEYRGFAIINH